MDPHPDNGKFFVGTKSVFNKTIKLIIQYKIYETITMDSLFANILRECLQYLSGLGMKEILQGDLMFTNSSKKTAYKDPTGKQEAMISFQLIQLFTWY